ncbi:MAG: DNA topoisomerase (ATP-hydrolyzing) subunit A [gamma proteobacterium endosymbiont of Trioza apicalis]
MNNLIKLINIEDELERSYLNYAMSVIIGRALPDVRDGLKPVHRRILFAMSILGNYWNKSYKKSARIVGDVIGKYHPHGDNSVYDAIVRMAQSFSLRYVLIDGQGNFGSIDGDSAAAMRYTEIRMSKIAHELLFDLDKETVDFVFNYDGSEKIPNVMPTRIPNLLINGATGIAVGMATNIPPHNLVEVINGCLAYIDNKNISIDNLMKYIPGPDFPTAAIINGKDGIRKAYNTGKGKIYVRASAKIEIDIRNNRENIIIYEIPYQVNKSRLIEKISNLVKEKRIEGISSFGDESDKDGIRIVIQIKRDSIGKVVLNNLYSLSQLQVSFCINMVALCHGKPKILSLKDILSYFIYHRREVVTRRTIFELRNAYKRLHILEGLIIALININFIIKLIKESRSTLDINLLLLSKLWSLNDISFILECNKCFNLYKKYLKFKSSLYKNKYYFSNYQVRSILGLRLHKLTNLEYNKLFNEYKLLYLKINKLSFILQNSYYLINIIRKELNLIKNSYNDLRRTKIINSDVNLQTIDLINKKNVVVTLSYLGYIKYQPLVDYEAQHRGGKGKLAVNIKNKDFVVCLLVTNTHNSILLFSSFGRMYCIKVYKLPEFSRVSRGKPIVNLLSLKKNERITAILSMEEYKYKKEREIYVFMSTSNGIVKKTLLFDLNRSRSFGLIVIKLNKGDELIGVALTKINDEIMLFSSYGKVVRFYENKVRNLSRSATGVRGINLTKGDHVVSLIISNGSGSILTVTKNGYGKRTLKTEYPIKSRATKGVISIKVSKRNGEVVSAVQVNDDDQIIIITNIGTLVRIKVLEINIIGRNTQGVKLIRTIKNENVVGLQCINEFLFKH